MATASTFISSTGNTWTSVTGTARSTTATWQAGDLIVALGITADNVAATMATPTATGLTFAAVSGFPTNTSNTCKAYAWQARATAAGSSVTVTSTVTSGQMANIEVYVIRNAGGIGATASSVSGTTLTVSLVRTYANSSVLFVGGDWGATNDTTVSALPSTNATVDNAGWVTGSATHFAAHWTDQGAAATTSYGLDSSTYSAGNTFTKIALEIIPSQPYYVNGTTASVATTPATTTAIATVSGGGIMVLTLGDDSATTNSVSSVTDSAGNTYTKVPISATNNVLTNSSSTQMWYAPVTTGGSSHTVSVAWNTGTGARMVICAQYFQGFVGTPTIDQYTGTTGTSTSASPGTTSATTQATELVVVGASHASTTSAFTLGTGYTNLTTVSVANAQTAQESKVVTATGTQTGALTIAASRAWGAIIATFYDNTTPPPAGGYNKANFFQFF